MDLQDKTVTKTVTDRGFNLCEFTDKYGAKCSLQESSANDPSIWFGVEPGFLEGCTWVPVQDDNAYTRMHLTQDDVKKLLPYLQRFANKGTISSSK